MNWPDYFRNQIREDAQLPSLEPLDAPCVDAAGVSDCAVVGCLYLDHALALAEQPIDIQNGVLRTWFCHNHPDRACRGAVNVVRGRRS